MAKKNKRSTRRTSAASPTTRSAASAGSSRSFDRDFSPDYAPVIKDLKRIGTLAAGFIVVFIVLSFII